MRSVSYTHLDVYKRQDSIQAAGLPDGHYKLGVNDVVVEDGDAKLADTGVRAGSTLSQDTALRNLMACLLYTSIIGISVEKLIKFAERKLTGWQEKREL